MILLTVMEYLCHKSPRICFTCRKHFPVLSSLMTYNQVCNQITTTGGTSGAGTAYPTGELEFTPGFQWGSCYSILSFICMFCRSLFVLLYFLFWPLCCLFFLDIRILITPLLYSNSSYNCAVFSQCAQGLLSILLYCMTSAYPECTLDFVLFLRISCCSMFRFLCRILQVIIFPFGRHCIVFFDLRLLVSGLKYKNFT